MCLASGRERRGAGRIVGDFRRGDRLATLGTGRGGLPIGNEPKRLKQGKAFHDLVQRSWEGPAENGPETRREERIALLAGERQRHGRIDLFIDKQSDFVSVIEIKATNWDSVRHRRKLLASHLRQIMKYVDKNLEGDGVNVCAGIIYPFPPDSIEIRREVEEYMDANSIQLLWWYDSAEAKSDW